MFDLRNYQSFAISAALDHFKYRNSAGILDISVAGGKTIIAKYIIEHFHRNAKRVLLIADREELLTQSGDKLEVPFSYYCTGLSDEKDVDAQIIVGSIQSVYNKEFPPLDLIIVDECQAIPNDKEQGIYWQFINKHPQAKLLGLTGTPYRVSGDLTWGDVIYSVKYPQLLDLKFVVPLTNKVSANPDLSEVNVTNLGDYSEGELEAVMIDKELLVASINAIKKYSPNRKKNLIFCVSVKHCELLKNTLQANNILAEVVTGKTPKDERRKILDNFKNGKLQHLITCELLLRGYDNPAIDMLTCLRPTKSKGLWEQLLGRAVRLHPSKENSLLIDLSGNLYEHGGLGSPLKQKGKKEVTAAKGKVCAQCEEFCKVTDRECPDCGFQFPEPEVRKVSHAYEHDSESDTVYRDELVSYAVKDVRYAQHKSKAGNITLRVDYICEGYRYNSISDYLSVHSENDRLRHKAYTFLKERGVDLGGDPKDSPMEDLLWNAQYLKKPSAIIVSHAKKYAEIKEYIYEEIGRESNPEGTVPVDYQGLLAGDEIPF